MFRHTKLAELIEMNGLEYLMAGSNQIYSVDIVLAEDEISGSNIVSVSWEVRMLWPKAADQASE